MQLYNPKYLDFNPLSESFDRSIVGIIVDFARTHRMDSKLSRLVGTVTFLTWLAPRKNLEEECRTNAPMKHVARPFEAIDVDGDRLGRTIASMRRRSYRDLSERFAGRVSYRQQRRTGSVRFTYLRPMRHAPFQFCMNRVRTRSSWLQHIKSGERCWLDGRAECGRRTRRGSVQP